MKITEVRVKLMEDPDDRLQAFCSITIDDWFVVRDLKIIDGSSGPFVAMPSRKLTSHCRKCRSKNHLRAHYCNQCGAKQHTENAGRDQSGRVKLYADIAHPINSECREEIQRQVITEYEAERKLAEDPNYVSRYDDEYDDDRDSLDLDAIEKKTPVAEVSRSDDSMTEESREDPTSQSTSRVEKTRIESEQQPSGPHQPRPSSKPAEGSTVDVSTKEAGEKHEDENGGDSFGAGIFD